MKELITIPGYLDQNFLLEEVSYLVGEGAYTKIIFLDTSWKLCSSNLAYFQKQGLTDLVRCHKRFMVFLPSIEEIIVSEHYTTDNNALREIKLIMPDRMIIPVSRRNEYQVCTLASPHRIPIGFDFNESMRMTKERCLELTQPVDWLM